MPEGFFEAGARSGKQSEGVGELFPFIRGQGDGVGLILEAAGFAGTGGAAVPGLHAEEGRAGLCPEGDHGEVLEVQGHAPARGLVAQGDALGTETLEDQGVQAAEGFIVQGDLAAVEHGLLPAAPDEPAGVQKEGVPVLGLVEGQLVILEPLTRKEGAADGGVGADAEGQGLRAGVLHSEGGGEAVFKELVPDLEDEGVRKLGQGLGALPELQDGEVRTLVREGELALPGEAVAAHFTGPAADVHPAVLQASDDGEEDGVLAGPEGGVALPDVFGSLPVSEGDQLAAPGADSGCQGGVGEGDVHGGTSCCSFSACSLLPLTMFARPCLKKV